MPTMKEAITALQAKKEHTAPTVEVQHILIAHKDAGIPGVKRTLAEAEKLAEEVWAKAIAGGDFGALVKTHTNDSPPGIYGMVLNGPGDDRKNLYARKGMVAAFGDTGWRLAVGEIGVAPFDKVKSPYGWHIVKRLK